VLAVTLAWAVGPPRAAAGAPASQPGSQLRAAPASQPRAEAAAPVEYITVIESAPQSAASAQTVRDLDLQLRTRGSPNDMVRAAPGVVTAQHQGGGKADQYFVRGFDCDHGSDLALSVDGLPVNLPSHAHGQGYADLHFLIPELVERLQVYKGPYFADQGDFATAGALNFQTARRVEHSFLSVGGGSFKTWRLLGVGSADGPRLHPYLAAEVGGTDGPFLNPEGLQRFNVFGKTTYDLPRNGYIGATFGAYANKWSSSGQIPEREVEAGRLSRFGAIDPSEGGATSRIAATLFARLVPSFSDEVTATLYLVRYRLALFSNFTLFLRDPENGDLIEQDDARVYGGARLRYEHRNAWLGGRVTLTSALGVEARSDDVHLDLWDVTSQHGQYRERLQRHAGAGNDDDVRIQHLAFYLEERAGLGRYFRVVASVRGDYFLFDDDPRADAGGTPDRSGAQAQRFLASPKATAVVAPHRTTELYLNFGTGFHSNDARVAVAARGDPAKMVPRAIGGEVGARTRLWDRLDLAAAGWLLYLQSEMVFSGDEGTFVPQGATTRYGLDFEARVRILKWLWADADVMLAHAEFVRDAGNGRAVALAPKLIYSAGLTARHPKGFKAAVRVRGIGDRPASEDGSLIARGYTVVDAFVGWEHRRFEVLLTIENVLNSAWREAQFGNASCTPREVQTDPRCMPASTSRPGVPDVHFTPGSPLGGLVTVRFFL
jgi:outer membrane receptor protein involved in Fe transport